MLRGRKITPVEPRYCVFCGKEIPRTKPNGWGLRPSKYNLRKWCQQKCEAEPLPRKYYNYLREKNKGNDNKFISRVKTK